MKNTKPEISFFLSYSSIFHLGAWRSSIELWTQKGYRVKLFQFKDPNNTKLKSDLEKKYKLVEIRYPFFLKGGLYIIKKIFRSLKFLGVKPLTNFGEGIAYIINASYYILATLILFKGKSQQVLIGGDSPGLVAAYLLLKKNRNLLVFWSLELILEREITNFGMRLFKNIEKRCNKHAICTIDFGKMRCKLLREENNLNNQVMFSIPNSPIGPARMKRNYFFNEMFHIPKEKKIILYAGGVYADFYRISDLWDYLKSWQPDWVLVIHTKAKSNIANKFIMPPNLTINQDFYFNDKPVPFEQIDKIYSSCDIGLVLNCPTGKGWDSNQLYSDLSLGKMFHYLQNGIPLIARNLPGFKELIEGNGVGICFDNASEIPQAIEKILKNKRLYKKNCLILHEKLRFDKHHEKFVKYIENKIYNKINK